MHWQKEMTTAHTVIKRTEKEVKCLHHAEDLMAISLVLLQPEGPPQTVLAHWVHRFAMSKASLPSCHGFAGQPADKSPETKEPRWTQKDEHKGRKHFSIRRQRDKMPEALSPEEPKKEIEDESATGVKETWWVALSSHTAAGNDKSQSISFFCTLFVFNATTDKYKSTSNKIFFDEMATPSNPSLEWRHS
jgi:hypothetical protein